MIDVRVIERSLAEKLTAMYVGKEYEGDEFPFSIAEGTSQFIAEIVATHMKGVPGFNVIPVKHGKVLMVSATDEEQNIIADVIFTVEYPEEGKENHMIIKNVLCSIKDYLFERIVEE